ncbi:MAG: serine hydrolase domain-containing protein [Acidimicrobiales bacterium]
MNGPSLARGTPEDVGLSAAGLDRVRATLQSQIDSGKAPTAAIVVARRGTIVMAEGFGTLKPGGPPTTVDHLFPLASGTKPLTAATLLSLAEDGLLGLNDSALSYLPELDRGQPDPPNLTDLLTHTAGLDSDVIESNRAALLEAGRFDVPEGRDLLSHILLEPVLSAPFARSPGALMVYENANYSLVGEVIRRVTGQTLHDVMTERIFHPLNLERSAVIVPEELKASVIERPEGLPYTQSSSDVLVLQGDLFADCDDGGVGVHMSAMDMAVFCQMILNGGAYGDTRVLSKAAVQTMVTNRVPGVPSDAFGLKRPEANWGYGFWIGDLGPPFAYAGGGLRRQGVIRHAGAGGIWTWIDPAEQIVGVVFEVVTEATVDHIPTSWATHRIEDMVAAAVID